MTWEQFQQYLVIGIQDGSIYALIGLGFTIIYAVTNIINFAQGEFVMLGGLCSYMLVDSVDIPTTPTIIIALLCAAAIGTFIHLVWNRRFSRWMLGLLIVLMLGAIPFVLFLYGEFASREMPVGVASFLPILMVAAVGAIMYILGIRTARRPSIVGLIIITIGAALVIRGIAGVLWGEKMQRTPLYWEQRTIDVFDATVHTQVLWILATMVVVSILLQLFLSRTMLGKSLKACATNQIGAGLMGINPRVMALIAFVLAAAVGGAIGAVMTPKVGMTYESGFLYGLYGFVAASLGGFRSPIGAVIGGFLLGVGRALIIGVDWWLFNSDYKDVWPMIILVVILLLRSNILAEEERLS
ncbi:MAG: branched-chain amino acid ABC transporter permease [Dehalococcoidia bacterium]